MQTQSLTQFDPSRFIQLPTTDPQAGRTINAQVGAIQSSTDFSGKVSVVTAEGDKVTFSLDVETDFRYLNYQYKAQFDDKSLEIKGEYAESSISQTGGLTVEGDLNEQEVADLTKLFKNVTSIFRKFFRGQDEQAVAKTAKLAERFGNFSSLGELDLSVDVTRSVTVLAAQLATQQAAEPAVLPSAPTKGTAGSPTPQQDTPGAAPSAVAAIPPPSSGITAPTQPLAPASPTGTSEAVRLTAPAMEDKNPESLVHQVLDAVHDVKVEAKNLRKYLPRFFEKMREDLQKEFRGENKTERKQTPDVSAPTDQAVFMAYQSTRKSSITLSIHT
jgi:hypothetical protein